MNDIASTTRRFWRLVPPADKPRLILGGAASGALLLALAVNTLLVQPLHAAHAAAQAKQNLHAVQLAVERFAVDQDDSSYPLRASDVLAAGYLPQLPPNPYTGQPMQEYSIDTATLPPGDFVYYPRDFSPATGKPTGYTLALGTAGLTRLRASIARR